PFTVTQLRQSQCTVLFPYTTLFRSYVCKNSGDETAARDIIQETLITIYDQAKTKGLKLTCPFDAYFFLICKRKWLNTLKKSGSKDRKSTRLNSSHVKISYAVFCLKK